MRIHGLQKMTLLDFPGKVACTVFLGGCDFRCPFCHNYELIDGTAPGIMDDEACFAFLEKRTGLLDGVAITGGEPCLHPGLPAFIERVRGMGFQVKLDTNGMHPQMLESLLERGLVDYVAMDIKNSPEKYAQTAGLAAVDLEKVCQSITLLMRGNVPYEFRTTVVAQLHAAGDFHAIGAWIRGARQYFLQKFEDRDSVPFGNLSAPSDQALSEYLQIMREYVPHSQLRGV